MEAGKKKKKHLPWIRHSMKDLTLKNGNDHGKGEGSAHNFTLGDVNDLNVGKDDWKFSTP